MLIKALILLLVTAPIVILGITYDIKNQGFGCQKCGTNHTASCQNNSKEAKSALNFTCPAYFKILNEEYEIDLCSKVVAADGRVTKNCASSRYLLENFEVRQDKQWVQVEINKCYRNIKIHKKASVLHKNHTSEFRRFCTCAPKRTNSTSDMACNSAGRSRSLFSVAATKFLLSILLCTVW